ncbi:phage tail protein I [Teredinibacter sp. KSP-S5-2]|uniref:phage tail protein I n=1 Tax=Teredinibacter sp. KSP-S5-2 TaxID=3034506 RepID=UPI0029348639|nr:phage tail protein I [Teredinibacter sp. KSP-S5-2]WNO10550.1 phage tail protein I [Teredinibacter sp. KSP-S5-2]
MSRSLLPPNRSELERALEKTLQRTTYIPIPLDTLWNPWACPAVLLPWLAWAVSVDYWESGWSVEQKRQAIADSLFVHQQKGTLASIERVLANLGVTANIREWFEFNGPPHTFELTAWVNDNFGGDDRPILNTQLYAALKAAVDVTKPVRSHYTFRIGVQLQQTLQFALASRVANRANVSLKVVAPTFSSQLPVHPVSTLRAVNVVRIHATLV